MERPIYEVLLTPKEERILEKMRKMCADEFEVTLQGNRFTLRFYHEKELVQVHMIVESIFDEEEE